MIFPILFLDYGRNRDYTLSKKGEQFMDEYRAPYLALFRAVTDALEQLQKQNYGIAQDLLIRGQQEAEELFICVEERPADS